MMCASEKGGGIDELAASKNRDHESQIAQRVLSKFTLAK